MEITFANNRIRKICTDDKSMYKELGPIGAKILRERLKQIKVASNLGPLRFDVGHWHELAGDRWGQLACSLDGRNRLVFEPGHDPRPLKPDGGLDWSMLPPLNSSRLSITINRRRA
jgi:proteic killer suppression protein